MIDKEKLKGQAEQFKGKVEQVVGKTIGSARVQARGEVDEVQGKAREMVADVKIKVQAAVKKSAE